MTRQEFHHLIRLFPLLLALFVIGSRASAEILLPSPPSAGSKPQDFVPVGLEILMEAAGDLNQDGKPDAALVLRNPAENTIPVTEEWPRLLVLLLQKPEGGYRLAAKSRQAILCRTCGGVFGDPLAEIQIKNGVLVIDHYGGSRDRWGYTHRWRHQDGDWVLIGETKSSSDTFGPEAKTDDVNLLTGDRIVSVTDSKGKVQTTKSKLPKQSLKKLSAFQFQ